MALSSNTQEKLYLPKSTFIPPCKHDIDNITKPAMLQLRVAGDQPVARSFAWIIFTNA
jgi:hypothetical protein